MMQQQQHYRILAPVATHWRAATCEEVECRHHSEGWLTIIDERTPDGANRALWVRQGSRRSFTEERAPDGYTVFRFEPGQICFRASDHRIKYGREPHYVLAKPQAGVRAFKSQDWTEEFATDMESQKQYRDRHG